MRPLPNLLLTSNIKYRWRQAVCPTDLTPNQLLPENINDLFLLCGGGFRSCARQRNRSCSFLNMDRCKGGTRNEYLHILFFYNASVNSTCAQPCQSWGWGICKFCAALGPGICQPRGHSRAFHTHAVSYQNITTQKVLLEKSRLAHLSRTGINCRGL